MTSDAFFAGHEEAASLFPALLEAVAAAGPAEMRVTKSQIAFGRDHVFALVWVPAMYLRAPVAPLVLTVSLRRRDQSPRWKEVVEAAPGRFTHHLEVRSAADLDDEVHAWLREAWEAAGPTRTCGGGVGADDRVARGRVGSQRNGRPGSEA